MDYASAAEKVSEIAYNLALLYEVPEEVTESLAETLESVDEDNPPHICWDAPSWIEDQLEKLSESYTFDMPGDQYINDVEDLLIDSGWYTTSSMRPV